jgi:hypothetical protein
MEGAVDVDDSDGDFLEDVSPPECRGLSSLSIDVDYGNPCMKDIEGAYYLERTILLTPRRIAMMHSQLSCMSLLMADSTQKSLVERKQMVFYGAGDTCLGKFLIDNCFQPNGYYGATPILLNQTLSFMHNPGRIDITVHRSSIERGGVSAHHIPMHLLYCIPILMSIFCKECNSYITEEVPVTDEIWSLSFGKYLDILMYNKSAYGSSSHGCTHRSRENHISHFRCVGLTTKIKFVPCHPFSVKVRTTMPLCESFHLEQTKVTLRTLLVRSSLLFEDFRCAGFRLDTMYRDLSITKPQELLPLVGKDIQDFQSRLEGDIKAYEDNLNNALMTLDTETQTRSPYFVFPMSWKRDLLFMCEVWNKGLQSLSDRLDTLRHKTTEPFSFFKTRVDSEDSKLAAVPDANENSPRPSLPLDSCLPVAEDPNVLDSTNRTKDTDTIHFETENRPGSSLSKAIALILGTDTSREKRSIVSLADTNEPSLYLPPGRHGEVICVSEAVPASIVAYSLASREYADQLQAHKCGLWADSPADQEESHVPTKPEDIAGYLSPPVSVTSLIPADDSSEPVINPVGTYSENPHHRSSSQDSLGLDIDSLDTNNSHPLLQPQSIFTKDFTIPIIITEIAVDDEDLGEEFTIEEPPPIALEQQMLVQCKSHVRHRFSDDSNSNYDHYYCCSYWSTQFEALRFRFLGGDDEGYIRSLSLSEEWTTQGGKSGAAFSKTLDGRLVVKVISRTELLMFNDFAPAYFEYISKALFHALPTVLCKIFGVYQVGFHNTYTNRKVVDVLFLKKCIYVVMICI